MFRTATWTAPTTRDPEPHFALGEHAEVVLDVVEPFPRGPRHQPRVRNGTRVRILETRPYRDRANLDYLVEVLDERGRGSGYWAIIPERDLRGAARIGFLDRLRALRT